MSTKRTKPSALGERVSVTEERVNNLHDQLPEIKQNLRTLVESVGNIQVNLAKLPTWEAVKESEKKHEALEERVGSLEGARSAIKVGWAIISTLGGIACVIIGWAISIWAR